VASGIAVEIEHGERVAVVGDNGQGKTTFLRTISDSLPTLSGEIRWGYGCQLGTYAQHVYASLPDQQTVREYLEYHAAAGVKAQTVLDVAGSFLFRGPLVDKRIKVLSGGERARLCLAGLLLGEGNVLVLDEPVNHLDVETVDALADALGDYRGTVIFTSHDRHFMNRVATAVVEVRDGQVAAYPGDYNTYVYRVEKEIDEGTRPADAPKRATDVATDEVRGTMSSGDGRNVSGREDHRRQKRVSALERKIARLDESRRAIGKQLLTATEAADAERLQAQQATVVAEIKTVEEEWFELQEEGD
jgi:ATP-binding cassette subfamily F protein 3